MGIPSSRLECVPLELYHVRAYRPFQIHPDELEKYNTAYGALLKASMFALRKRDRKREKARAELQAQKRKKLAEEIKVDGPKRGNGRKKRQRLAKALQKQQETKERIEKAKEQRTTAPAKP